MFSGIIEHKAKILFNEEGVFRVENTFPDEIKIGQSIAHDGACMTITKIEEGYYEFFTMQESMKSTNFSFKKNGNFFNIERCLQIGNRIDGHIVSGHIDTVGKIIQRELRKDNSLILKIGYPKTYNDLVIKKGSITVNGVSLTVVEDGNEFFTVSLIPLTQDWTNLGDIELGDLVNLEFDMLGKYILKSQKNSLHKEGE